MGLYLLDRDTILASGISGVMTWRPNDKNVTLACLPLGTRTATFLTAWPERNLAFVSQYQQDTLFGLALAEGNWTLMPRRWLLPEAKLASGPVVLPKTNQVAVGGQNQVYVVALDDQGRARPQALRVGVTNPNVRALVYSVKFDRLYVGVEQGK